MKIKTTKQMRLDELIKYIRENEIKVTEYVNNVGGIASFSYGQFSLRGGSNFIDIESPFKVPVEEEVTEDTVFDELHEYFWDLEDGLGITEIHTNESISGIQEEHCGETVLLSITVRIKADNEPILIWSKDTGIPAEGVIEV